MALLTAEEADRIVRANFRVSGATSDALMDAWRGMVFAMLERIDLGVYRRNIIDVARDIVKLWSFAQPACTYNHARKFAYPDMQALQLVVFFNELHRLTMSTLLAAPELPPRSETEWAHDTRTIGDIAQFAREHRDEAERLARSDASSYIECTAGELSTAAGCCRTLISIALGVRYAAEFTQQYDNCISAWMLAVPLITDGA